MRSKPLSAEKVNSHIDSVLHKMRTNSSKALKEKEVEAPACAKWTQSEQSPRNPFSKAFNLRIVSGVVIHMCMQSWPSVHSCGAKYALQ